MIIELSTGGVRTLSGHDDDNWIGAGFAVVPKNLEALCWEHSPFLTATLDKKGGVKDIVPDTAKKAAFLAALEANRE